MIDVATRHRRVVQVGTQQRSGSALPARQAAAAAAATSARFAARASAPRATSCRASATPVGKPPVGRDWDMWLGPAPDGAVQTRRAASTTSAGSGTTPGGQMTNLLAHDLDIVQWVTGQVPRRVAAFAQRQSLTGIGETPDVFEGIFEYPGFLLNWSSREVAAGGRGGLEMSRHQGHAGDQPARLRDRARPSVLTPEAQIPRFTGPGRRPDADAGLSLRGGEGRGLRPGARPVPAARPELPRLREVAAGAVWPTSRARTRRRSRCHLANIAMRTGRVVQWDADATTSSATPRPRRC